MASDEKAERGPVHWRLIFSLGTGLQTTISLVVLATNAENAIIVARAMLNDILLAPISDKCVLEEISKF